METSTFIRKPFVVDAIRITKENIAELAPEVGTLKQKNDGTPFIQVDRHKVPNVFKVWPGYWLTRMNGNVRCYSNKIFEEQFAPSTDEAMAWVNYMNAEQVTETSSETAEASRVTEVVVDPSSSEVTEAEETEDV